MNGANSFLLTAFSIDLTQIKTIRVSVFDLDPSDSVEIQDIAAVPEPGTGLLLAIGLVGIALRKSRAR